MARELFEVKVNDNVLKLAIRKPTIEDLNEADEIYAEKVASLIKDGIGGRKKLLLRSQLNDYLRGAGVWTDKDDQDVRKLQLDIAELLEKIKKGGVKLSEGKEIALQISNKRREIVRINQKRQIFDDTTIESIAENDKIDYLIYSCTVYADDGRNYWESFEDMKNDKLNEVYREAARLSMKSLFNIDPQFEKNLPENKWLKKYNFVDEDLNYIDRKTGERVDREGRPIKELEAELEKLRYSLQGDIEEEAPFVDDDTNEPIVT